MFIHVWLKIATLFVPSIDSVVRIYFNTRHRFVWLSRIQLESAVALCSSHRSGFGVGTGWDACAVWL